MESQSEGQQFAGANYAQESAERRVVNQPTQESFVAPDGVQRFAEASERDVMSVEPSQDALESGAAETIAFYESATGQKITMDDDDGETLRILYELSRQRKTWPEAMERDARCALQSIYPDVGGSAVHGPL